MKRLLIVDDAMFMRSTLKMILSNHGYEIIGEAGNGIEAIEKYKTLQPDLVTMDIHMPEMGGLDALTQIMNFDSNATIVMITAAGDQKHVMDAMQIGAKTLLSNPLQRKK